VIGSDKSIGNEEFVIFIENEKCYIDLGSYKKGDILLNNNILTGKEEVQNNAEIVLSGRDIKLIVEIVQESKEE